MMRTLHSFAALSLALLAFLSSPPSARCEVFWDPAATEYSGNRGSTLYVSKLGDNSDGSSWAKAFHTIQAALLAVPNGKGGHRVVVRPDTYAEANLYPAFSGAEGAYNLLVGDYDGSLGSGAEGWVVLDSGAPLEIVRTNPKAPTGNPTFMIVKEGDPEAETGLKSVDWWGPWRCDPDHSAVVWDRWIYRLQGKVSAYVQYRQAVPAGFERLRFWPVETFNSLMPAVFSQPVEVDRSRTRGRPELVKLPFSYGGAMENSPVVYQDRLLLGLNYRDDTKNKTDEYKASMYLFLRDLQTGNQVARFAEGHSFVNLFVRGNELNAFATEGSNHDWFQSIYRFSTTNLTDWKRELAIEKEGDEHLFNSSVCQDDQGYLMAYESNLPVQFCFRFARSKDLSNWTKIPGLTFTGVNREYSACPVIRFIDPYYYVIYLHAAVPGHEGWVSFMARSRDLASWELSPWNPILEAGKGEGMNNSDVDLFEHEGRTYLYYATGDQATWGAVRVAMYPGRLQEFYERHFPAGQPMIRFSAANP
jgi:hypothetical protein